MPAGADDKSRSPATGARTWPLTGLRLTPAGLIFIAVSAVNAVAALHSEANLLFLVFCLSLGVLLFSAVAPVVMVRRIEVDRVLPQAAVADRPFAMVYVVRNRRRWGNCWGLLIQETPADRRAADLPWAFVARLAPGASEPIELVARCPTRGRLALSGIRVTSRFPFGLLACSVGLSRPADLIVYPAVGRLRADLTRSRREAQEPGTRAARSRSGGDEEFSGVREYRQGDNVRWIHWRRSAHVGELVVRESISLQAKRLVILLDPWPDGEAAPARTGDRRGQGPSGTSDAQAAERLISAAATAACDAIERGHQVGLIARAKVPVALAPAGGRPHRQRVLRELALLSAGRSDSLDALVSQVRWSGSASGWCLLCTPRVTEAHRRVRQVLARQAAVILVSPGTEWFETVFNPPPDRRDR